MISSCFPKQISVGGGSVLMAKDEKTSLWHLVGFNHAIGIGGWKWENQTMFITHLVYKVFNYDDIQMLFRTIDFLDDESTMNQCVRKEQIEQQLSVGH